MSLTPASKIMSKLRQQAVAGVEDAGELVVDEADHEVPRDTGRLARSRRVEVVEASGGRVVVKVSYGEGLPDDRAVVVHEDLDANHSSGGAKYLERAMAASLPQVRDAIARSIRKEF